MKNPIEIFLRDHITVVRDLIAEREPSLGVETIARRWTALRDHFGENGANRIHDRARALVRQLFGGDDAPPLPNYKIDGYAAVEADLCAEKILAECRRAGVRPSRDPAWRSTLNQRFAAMFDRYTKQLEARAARLRAPAPAPSPNLDAWRDYVRALLEHEIAAAARWQSLVSVSEVSRLGALAFPNAGDEKYRLAVEHIVRYAAAAALGLPLAPNPVRDLEVDRDLTLETARALRKYAEAIAADIVKRQANAPAPSPAPPKLDELVEAAVTRALDARQVRNGPAVDARSAEHRHGIAVTDYAGVWEQATYGAGTMVTHNGQLWFAQAASTTGRPGNSPDWKLMHKSLEKAGR
jgi:hypothetical protein